MDNKKRSPQLKPAGPDEDGERNDFVLEIDTSDSSNSPSDEKTFALEEPRADSKEDTTHATEVVLGRPQPPIDRKGASGHQSFSSEVTLRQAEHLKTAQKRVQELEKELDVIRRQNEELFSAAETIRNSKEEMERYFEKLKLDHQSFKETQHSEAQILRDRAQHKEQEIKALKKQGQDLQDRLDQSFRQVRKREKELEHRLEILKMDGQAVLKSKDSTILELKEKLDGLQFEKEKLGKRNHALSQEIQEKEAVLRRVARALRLALVQLEDDDDSHEESAPPRALKKVK